MSKPFFGLLRFDEAYFDRIWGGTRLRERLCKPTPPGHTIGEVWLLADHAEHKSSVVEGPHAGRTLQELLDLDETALLGARAKRTIHGRFPLLLKLLDSAQALSVQVHPNDQDAARMGEPDVGKTEMWHVIEADPNAELICGLQPGVTREQLAQSINNASVEQCIVRFPAPAGTSAYIPAGTVHAIGGGILLAEIQQNSNITYRLYDWNRLDECGKPRPLHIEQALEVTNFAAFCAGPAPFLSYIAHGARRDVLAASPHFLAEAIHVDAYAQRPLDGTTFHLLLVATGAMDILSGNDRVFLAQGQALLVPAATKIAYEAIGMGVLLDYSVPNLSQDVVAPLLAAGHSPESIARLGGFEHLDGFLSQV